MQSIGGLVDQARAVGMAANVTSGTIAAREPVMQRGTVDTSSWRRCMR